MLKFVDTQVNKSLFSTTVLESSRFIIEIIAQIHFGHLII